MNDTIKDAAPDGGFSPGWLLIPPIPSLFIALILVLMGDSRRSASMPAGVWILLICSYIILCFAYAVRMTRRPRKGLVAISMIAQGIALIAFTSAFGAPVFFNILGTLFAGGGLIAAACMSMPAQKRFTFADETIFQPDTTARQAEAILETTPIPGFFAADGELVTALNGKMASLLGKGKPALLGKPVSSLLPSFEDGKAMIFAGNRWTPSITRKGAQMVVFLAPDSSAERKVEVLEIVDPETGLYTLQYLSRRGMEELEGCRRYKRRLTVLLIKLVFRENGDRIPSDEEKKSAYAAFGAMLARLIRTCDAGFRMAHEDEFLLLLPDTPQSGAKTALSRIESGMKKLASLEQRVLANAEVQTGTACYFGEDAGTVDGMMKDVYISLARAQGKK